MDVLDREERKKETGDNRVNQQRLVALTIAAALVGLTILLLNARTYFPATYYPIFFILITVILLVLFSGLYGSLIIKKFKKYSEKRKHDKLAKSYFKQFKKLVVRFKEFEGRNDNIQTIMHYIKNTLSGQNPYSQINVVQPMFIQQRYEYYIERPVNLMELRIIW